MTSTRRSRVTMWRIAWAMSAGLRLDRLDWLPPSGGCPRVPAWKGDRSPARQGWCSPGVLRLQSGWMSRSHAHKSCHRPTNEGRPQNQ